MDETIYDDIENVEEILSIFDYILEQLKYEVSDNNDISESADSVHRLQKPTIFFNRCR